MRAERRRLTWLVSMLMLPEFAVSAAPPRAATLSWGGD